MGAPATSEKKEVRMTRAPAGLVPWQEWIVSLITQIAASVGVRVSVQGARRSAKNGGGELHFDIEPGAGTGTTPPDHNWKVQVVDTTHVTVSPGYVNTGVPTISVSGTPTAIDTVPAPQLVVSSSVLNYIYLKVTRTVNTVSSRVTGQTITAREILAYSSTQTSTNTVRFFLLATHDPSQPAASRVTQSRYWNFEFDCIDDGTATSTPESRSWVAA